jgi:hypothetical protein
MKVGRGGVGNFPPSPLVLLLGLSGWCGSSSSRCTEQEKEKLGSSKEILSEYKNLYFISACAHGRYEPERRRKNGGKWTEYKLY